MADFSKLKPLQDILGGAQKFAGSILPQIGNTVQNVENYFNPTVSGTQGFWGTPVAQGMANTQQTIQNIPQQTQSFYQQNITPIVKQVANQPILNNPTPFKIPSPTIRQTVNTVLPNFEQSTLGNIIKGNFTQVPQAFNKDLTRANDQMKLDTPEKVNTFLSGMIGGPEAQTFSKAQLGLVRNGFTKEVRNLVGQFAKIVEENPNVNRANLGSLGDYIQTLGQTVFGKDAVNLTNKQLKNAFDAIMQEAFKTKQTGLSIGLATKNIREGEAKPIGQILEENKGKIPLAPNSNTPLPVNPPQRIGLLQKAFNRARNVIASQGEAGKALADSLQQVRNQAETTAGNWTLQMPTVRALNNNEFKNFVDVAEGNTSPISQKVAQAVQEWTKIREDVYSIAKQSGFDIGRLENYFPHTYDPAIFTNKNKYNEAINHLVNSGQAKTQTEAIRILSHVQDIIRNRRHGNLEIERLVNLPNYEKTKNALFGYLDSAANRIAQVNTFGQNDEGALKLIEQIARQGGDASTVKDMFDIAVGAKKYGETSQQISRTLRNFNTVTKLGLGAITNAGQSVNTATVTGAVRTLLNAPKAVFSKESKDFALKVGTTLDTVLQQLREGGGYEGKLGQLGAPGFNVVEKFNRTLASIAGRDYARSLAQKGDTTTLAKMGIVLKGNKLTPEQEIQAARNIVERTQFKVDPQDLPGWASSPLGKIVSQFRTFSYNQSAFMGREVIGPALKGNVAPLLRFVGIGIPIGIGLQTTKNILRNRKDEENPIKRVQQGFGQVGGLGLAGDIVTGLFPMNGRYLDPNRATTMAIGTLGGPTLGTIAEGYGSLTNAIQGKPANLGRFALKQVPLVGSTLQNTILPYKSQSGDVNRRFDFGAQKVEANSNTEAPTVKKVIDNSSLTPVEEANIKNQISQLDKKEKEILANSGMNIFGNQIGGLTEDQKNQQLNEIKNQQEQLKSQLEQSKASYKMELNNTNYSLTADRLKRADDYQGWIDVTTKHIDDLTKYQQTLPDPKDQLSIQNKIEDLRSQVDKYKTYGGFTKPKKIKVPKLKLSATKLKSPKKIKLGADLKKYSFSLSTLKKKAKSSTIK